MTPGTNFRHSAGDDKHRLKERYQITIPPAELMNSIAMPPAFDRSFELQQGLPIDGSKQYLRAYSPFTIEVVPPLIFSNNPRLEDGTQSKHNVNTIAAGWKQNNAFEVAKNKIQTRDLDTQKFNSGASRKKLETFVAKTGQQYKKSNTDKSKYATQNTMDSPVLSDVKVAADIALQLSRILKTPPLTLLINPQTFQVQYAKIQQFSERVRNGYIFQAWGEEQPKISFSGKTGAFYAGAADLVPGVVANNQKITNPTRTPTGVQFASKRNSASWQNLMSIFQLYMNNGYIMDQVNKSNAHHFVGALAIKYDQWVYIGNMNSFSFGYEDTQANGGMQFDIEFNVVAMYDQATPVQVVQPMTSPTSSPSSRRNRPNTSTGNSQDSQDTVLFGRGSGQNPEANGKELFFNRDVGTPPAGGATTVASSNKGFRTPAATPPASAITGTNKKPPIFTGPGRSGF